MTIEKFNLACTWFLVGFLLHTVMIGKDLEFSILILCFEILAGLIQLTMKSNTDGKEVSGI